jgi:hypothetical protein
MTGVTRIALFVEGSDAPPAPRGQKPLEQLWNRTLRDALGIARFEVIVPISKKHIIAMDPQMPVMSGRGEPLDAMMTRVMQTRPFDAAVVAWDLVPDWNSTGDYCRHEETLNFYRLLSRSKHLPRAWQNAARARHRQLRGKSADSPSPLGPGVALAVCMEPMFEGLLTQSEPAIRRALGLRKRPKGWPRAGWGESSVQLPASK